MKATATALSRQEMLDLIEEHVVHHMPDYGSLMALSSRDYDALNSEHGVQALITKTYRWLGSKPTKVTVTKDQKSTPSSHTFIINPYDQEQPYVLASHAVLFALKNTLIKRLGNPVSDDMLEIASIQTGLGLIVMNALVTPDTALHLWHHGKRSGSHHIYHLQTMTVSAYAEELATYAHTHTIRAQTLLAGLHKATHQHMPKYYTHHQVAPLAAPNLVVHKQRHARFALIRVSLLALLIALISCIGIYLNSQQPYRPSTEARDQFNKIQSLEYQYNYCKNYLQEQQNNYNQSDISTESNLAQLAQDCDSLKKQYNYHVSTYNELTK